MVRVSNALLETIPMWSRHGLPMATLRSFTKLVTPAGWLATGNGTNQPQCLLSTTTRKQWYHAEKSNRSARHVRANVVFDKTRIGEVVRSTLQNEMQGRADEVVVHITVDGVVTHQGGLWLPHVRWYQTSCWVYASTLHTTHCVAGDSVSKIRFTCRNEYRPD